MWDTRAPGSELLVRDTVRREMNRLYEERLTYDDITHLSACQAYLLYCIHLFFSPDSGSPAMVETSTMINLQELASAMSLTGLGTTGAPFYRTNPSWEAWIIAEAKLRTLYTMYMFDNVFCFSQNAPVYVATELGRLPAPASKALWAAANRDEWGSEYGCYLAEWPSEIPRVEDFWPHHMEEIVKERRERIDRYVESIDDFGMFMLAACSMTHFK